MPAASTARRPGQGLGVLAAANASLVALVIAGLALPALALALVVAVAIAIVARPQRGVLLLAALVPFHGLLLIAPLPAWVTAWKEVLLLATVAATFLAPAGVRAGSRPLPRWTPALGGILGLSLASAVLVGGVQAFWGIKIAFFFVLVAVAVWRCPLDPTERDRLVTILMIDGAITAAYGIAQQFIGQDALNRLGYEYDTAIRFTGSFLRSFSSFNLPFSFGYFLMLVLLVGSAHSWAEPRRLRSRLFLLATPVLGLGLVFSFVRGAWIGLAVGIAYLGLVRFRVLLLGIPLVAVALLFLPGDLANAALQARSGGQRVEVWQANLARLTSHPIGLGVGSSGSAAEKVGKARITGGDVLITDNQYYKAVYELGVLGLWMLVLLLVGTFLSARRAARALPPPDDVFALAAAAMVLAAAAASLVTSYFDTFPMEIYFWLLMAVVETSAPPTQAGRSTVAAVPTGHGP